jgi:drug/metabolite transporter (DMT)-like permease
MRAIPQYKYAMMGLFDMLFNLTSTWPVPYLSGSLVNVLAQSALPFTMVGSILFLRPKYRSSHYLGAILVVYGIMVRLIPNLFLGHDEGAGKYYEPGLWITVLVLSNIPSAASNVYKELALKDVDCDVFYMNAPTVALRLPAPAPVIPLSDIPSYISNSSKCFFLGANQQPGDMCHGVGMLFVAFLVFNFACKYLVIPRSNGILTLV